MMVFKAILGMGLTLGLISPRTPAEPCFSPSEKEQILDYWAEAKRLTVALPPAAKTEGSWKVRLSVEGSVWLSWLSKAKTTAADPELWDAWASARLAHDNWSAGEIARKKDMEETGRSLGDPKPEPPDPGEIPADLKTQIGEPPPLAEVVQPHQYSVRFDSATQVDMIDNVPVSSNSPSYRSCAGVRVGGQAVCTMPPADCQKLFDKAGLTPPEERVFKAVSTLEGGFDSVNTYDTGFVSAGFIQFACLSAGCGSLGHMLCDLRSRDSVAFNVDFRRFGIDVEQDGTLVALDPSSGEEFTGADAARKIIADKRLTAVFVRAGRVSEPYRLEQIRFAKASYYPADDFVAVPLAFGAVTGKVSDFIHSEAGLAILMDRKVHLGRLDPLNDIVAQELAKHQLNKLSDLSQYEDEIIAKMVHRKDFRNDPTLASMRDRGPLGSRGGARKGR